MTDDGDERAQGRHGADPSADPAERPTPRPSRPLTPTRPWQVDRAAPVEPRRPAVAERKDAPAARPNPARRRPGLGPAPSQPSAARLPRHASSEPGPEDAPDSVDDPVPGLAPIRPWQEDRTAGPLPSRTPLPSNPDIVLESLAAQVTGARPAETDDERRRRFARQHAAADAARLAALVALPPPTLDSTGPPPPSYEPDPAVYDLPDEQEGEPRKRRFGRRRRPDETPVVTTSDDVPQPAEPVVPAPVSYSPDPLVAEPAFPPEPVAPEPVAPEPVAPEPVVPELVAPEPVAPEPVAPEPGAPEPAAPRALHRGTRWLFERSPDPEAPAAPEKPVAEKPVAEEPVAEEPAAIEEPVADEPAAVQPAGPPPVLVDITDTPSLDLEVADEFHGEPEAPVAQTPPAEIPDPPARRGWRRRHAAQDDEEGPFFPPEPAVPAPTLDPPAVDLPAVDLPAVDLPTLDLPTVASVLDDVPLPAASEVPAVPVSRNRPRPRPRPTATIEPAIPPSADTMPPAAEQPSPERRRPRPRPSAARAAASPAAETSTEPDPAGPTDPPPPGHRSPDISRFLAATEPRPGDDAPEPKEPMRRRLRIRGSRGLRIATRVGIVAVVAVAAAIVLRIYVVAPYYIPSASMEPTLHGGSGTNDRILVDKISYRVHDPHEGDIVVFNRPDTWNVPDKTLVKRVIGLPGDRIALRSGLVYVNGLRLTESYINTKACGPAPTKPLNGTSRWTVPMGDYFVMGDNRCNSDDSRMFGPIPGSKIVGRAFVIIWPLSRFGTP